MSTRAGTGLEQCGALRDTLDIALEYGDLVSVYVREEASIRRDLYEDIKSGKTIPDVIPHQIPVFPVTFQPNRKQLEKAGLKEDCDVLVYTPMLSWTLLGVDFEDIDMSRTTVDLKKIKYVIKEKSLAGQFVDTFLNITLALRRK